MCPHLPALALILRTTQSVTDKQYEKHKLFD